MYVCMYRRILAFLHITLANEKAPPMQINIKMNDEHNTEEPHQLKLPKETKII